MSIRRDGIYFRRVWWWFPWRITRWWLPKIWRGGDEWCNVPLCFTVPPLGVLLIFHQPMRMVPCGECWAEMPTEQRAAYEPGGYLENGRVWPEREPAGLPW